MEKVVKLLKQYLDCFAWDYTEMPGLDRSLVEHKIPLRQGYKPHKQPPRRFSEQVIAKRKEEVLRLLAVEFIEVAVYVEWLSNVVPVLKKNGKTRVCTDFRNLNLASPKDEYHMPIAEILIDRLVGYKYKTFVDGNAGYNQIYIAREDVPKTAFRCPQNSFPMPWSIGHIPVEGDAVRTQECRGNVPEGDELHLS